jgi:hypothetical protein
LFFKAWNFGYRLEELQAGNRIDVLFTVEDDPGSQARGYDGWSFTLKDVRPST